MQKMQKEKTVAAESVPPAKESVQIVVANVLQAVQKLGGLSTEALAVELAKVLPYRIVRDREKLAEAIRLVRDALSQADTLAPSGATSELSAPPTTTTAPARIVPFGGPEETGAAVCFAFAEGEPEEPGPAGVSAFHRYLTDIKEYREEGLLTHEKCSELAEKARSGDSAARNDIVLHNLGFVFVVAREFAWVTKRSSITLGDLVQWGNIGLMEAAERFDGGYGAKFTSYAAWWIRQGMHRGIMSIWPACHIPFYCFDRRRRMLKTYKEKGVSATELDWLLADADPFLACTIAKMTGLSVRQVRAVMAAHEALRPLSFEALCEDDDTALVDEAALPPDQVLQFRDDCREGCRLLSEWWRFFREAFDERAVCVFLRRYDLHEGGWLAPSFEMSTLEEIAGEWGLTRERVRQILRGGWRDSRRARRGFSDAGLVDGHADTLLTNLRRLAALASYVELPLCPQDIFPLED